MVKPFVRYVQARFKREIIEHSYRCYVTDSLRLIPQMAYFPKRWDEIISPRHDDRTADEIVDDVVSRFESRLEHE